MNEGKRGGKTYLLSLERPETPFECECVLELEEKCTGFDLGTLSDFG